MTKWVKLGFNADSLISWFCYEFFAFSVMGQGQTAQKKKCHGSWASYWGKKATLAAGLSIVSFQFTFCSSFETEMAVFLLKFTKYFIRKSVTGSKAIAVNINCCHGRQFRKGTQWRGYNTL